MDMGNKYLARLEAVRSLMREKNWDAFIITGSDPHNSEYPAKRWKQIEWLCGFSGESADVVVTLEHAGLWTDSRYFIEAAKTLKNTGVDLHKSRVPGEVPIPQWLAEFAFPEREKKITIAVDGLTITQTSVESIEKALAGSGMIEGDEDEGFSIINAPDWIDSLWIDRPLIPDNPIITLGEDIAGESRLDKLLWLRGFLIDKNCRSILITALDEIAWLLNIRGSDVDYNPVVLSYLTVSLDDVKWYVRKSTYLSPDEETAESFRELKSDGIEILPYEDIDIALGELEYEEKSSPVYIDPYNLNYSLYNIAAACLSIVYGPSPVPLRKAVKNSVEIDGIKEAHLEDGLAMESFLYWLEKSLEAGDIVTERDAAEKLSLIRSSIDGYKGDSFETISAYGQAAALPHYVTPFGDSPVLEKRGLYLCDSGGQYIFGTTDITRTIPLGPCSSLEKEDYTLVLKGHIDLAMAVFPKGTAGCHLDILARNPLWSVKRNFGHGTGHGVGFFLNVHEGPQDIRQNFNTQALLPGMITSDEPGIYREGLHGVRHENLLLCKECGANDFGTWLCFEVLTLCHIDTSIIIKELLTRQEKEWLNSYNRRVFETLSPRLPERVAKWLKEKTGAI